MFHYFLLPLQSFSEPLYILRCKLGIMKKQKHGGRLLTALVLGLVASGAIMAYFLFMPMSKTGDTEYVYIDTDDDIDSVMVKVGVVLHYLGSLDSYDYRAENACPRFV